MQQEHRIVAYIRCPPEGEEDSIGRRLRDAASYRVWVTVECDHVQPGIANVTTSDAVLHLPHPPEAVFLTHQLLPNKAAVRTMQLYAALTKACQQREELIQRVNAFDRRAILPDRLWGKSTNLLNEQRMRKVNIRRLLQVEAGILELTREHEAMRAQASLSLRLKWQKPREHGAARVRRYVVQLLEAPWNNAVLGRSRARLQ